MFRISNFEFRALLFDHWNLIIVWNLLLDAWLLKSWGRKVGDVVDYVNLCCVGSVQINLNSKFETPVKLALHFTGQANSNVQNLNDQNKHAMAILVDVFQVFLLRMLSKVS